MIAVRKTRATVLVSLFKPVSQTRCDAESEGTKSVAEVGY